MNPSRIRNAMLILALAAMFAMLTLSASGGAAQAPVTRQHSSENPQAVPPGGFTYQGLLKFNGLAHTGVCDFQFSIWNALSAGSQIGSTTINANVGVANGLFNTFVNLNPSYHNAAWLEIAARCPAGGGSYTTLSPRSPITPAPLAGALKYGTSVRPPTGGTIMNDGFTAFTNAAEAGYTNPVAIVGSAAQNSGGNAFAYPSGPTGILGASDIGNGMFGSSGSGNGIFGVTSSGNSSKGGVVGQSVAPAGTGVYGFNNATDGTGVYGYAPNGAGAFGVWAQSSAGYALYALSTTPCCQAAARIQNYGTAVALWATQHGGNAAIFGNGPSGVVGEASVNGGVGVIGRLANGVSGLAGQFLGNVDITGIVLSPGNQLHIDHPADPANQYLNQAAMYSPEMLSTYSGNVTTDAGGFATVQLPAYVEALNTDFRYQLTVLGQFAQAIVSAKIQNGQFVIQTDKPNVEVSWQVTGVRQDAYALANPLAVEQDKLGAEAGLYLFPQGYGLPASQGLVDLYSAAAQAYADQDALDKQAPR